MAMSLGKAYNRSSEEDKGQDNERDEESDNTNDYPRSA